VLLIWAPAHISMKQKDFSFSPNLHIWRWVLASCEQNLERLKKWWVHRIFKYLILFHSEQYQNKRAQCKLILHSFTILRAVGKEKKTKQKKLFLESYQHKPIYICEHLSFYMPYTANLWIPKLCQLLAAVIIFLSFAFAYELCDLSDILKQELLNL